MNLQKKLDGPFSGCKPVPGWSGSLDHLTLWASEIARESQQFCPSTLQTTAPSSHSPRATSFLRQALSENSSNGRSSQKGTTGTEFIFATQHAKHRPAF